MSGESVELLHTALARNAHSHPDKTALLYESSPIPYKTLWESVERFKNWFLHVPPESRVGLLLENTPELVYGLYAIPAAGLVAVPLESALHERNLSYIVRECGIEMALTSEKFLPKWDKATLDRPLTLLLTDSDARPSSRHRIVPLKEILEGSISPPKIPSPDAGRSAFILYTTGTTGPKKGVLLSHFNLVSATKQINQFMQLGDWVIESLPMPLSHSFGFGRLRCVLEVGGTVILEKGLLRPERVLEEMKKKRANAISSVPAGFAILLERFSEPFGEIGPSLRVIEIGSAFMPLRDKQKLMTLCPNARISMHYGLTEASRATFIEFHSEKAFLHTVGRPSPHVSLRIADEGGKTLGVDTVGEILIKGDMVMQGYWNQPELTRKVLAEGWLRTGDLGLVDEKGYLHLMGRKDDLINLGGLKVAPGEVEEVLLHYKGVVEAAVVGSRRKEGVTDETIKAFVVVNDPGEEGLEEALEKHCLKELEPYKVPAQFEIVPSLPKTASGKIQRHLLRQNGTSRGG